MSCRARCAIARCGTSERATARVRAIPARSPRSCDTAGYASDPWHADSIRPSGRGLDAKRDSSEVRSTLTSNATCRRFRRTRQHDENRANELLARPKRRCHAALLVEPRTPDMHELFGHSRIAIARALLVSPAPSQGSVRSCVLAAGSFPVRRCVQYRRGGAALTQSRGPATR